MMVNIKRTLKNAVILCGLFLMHITVIAQETKVKWGGEIAEGRFDQIIEASNGAYYATRTFGSFLEELTNNYSTSISIIQNLAVKKTVTLSKEWKGNKLRYEGMTNIKNQLVVFYSTTENNLCYILHQVYSETLEPSPLVVTTSFEQPKNNFVENDIYLMNTKNNLFGGVIYSIEDSKKKEMSFGYVILNDSISVHAKGEQRIPIDANQLSFGSYTLGNKGELYIAYNVKVSPTRKKWKNNILSNFRIGPFSMFPIESQYTIGSLDDLDAIQSLLIYKCENKQVSNLSHKFSKTTINAYKMRINSDGNLLLFGTFLRTKQDKMSNRSELSMNGIFTLQVDLVNWRIAQEKFEDIPLNIYTYGLSDRKKNRIENNYAQGKLLPKLYDYTWKNATSLPNGDIVGHLEQTVRNVTYTTYNNGYGMGYGTGIGGYSPYSNTTANVTYYFKDVLVFCLKSDGAIRWMKKIQKIQASSSYDGAYVSCFSFLTNKHYSILFSDNAKNYAANGIFMSDKKIYGNPIFAKNNILSRVTIDLQTGETKRAQFLAKETPDGSYMPRDFHYNPTNNNLLLLLNVGGLGTKIKCGSLVLDN
jgi:hypothetical protein